MPSELDKLMSVRNSLFYGALLGAVVADGVILTAALVCVAAYAMFAGRVEFEVE